MKQFFLAVAVFFMAVTASKAQGTIININNTTGYTLYMVLSADATCNTPNRAFVTIAPGTTTYTDPTMVPIPGAIGTDMFYEVRVYNYHPATTCYTQQSINLSPCTAGLPLTDFITIYDMCVGGTPYFATVQWDNTFSPASVDLNIF